MLLWHVPFSRRPASKQAACKFPPLLLIISKKVRADNNAKVCYDKKRFPYFHIFLVNEVMCGLLLQVHVRMKLSVIIFGLLCFGATTSVAEEKVADDIFSSISKMEALVHQENAIVDMLDSFLVDAKQRLNIIQK